MSRLLPDRPRSGECRLCGQRAMLTFEHIPPAAAFNRDLAVEHSATELDTQSTIEGLEAGHQRQRGVGGHTLCERCNTLTGAQYGHEYVQWARIVHRDLAAKVDAAGMQSEDSNHEVDLNLEPVYPGKFIRQVLSMMCTISNGELRRRAPIVTDVVLHGATQLLPAEISVHLAIAPDPHHARILGNKLEEDLEGGGTAHIADMVRYPFALFLILEGRDLHARRVGCDITGWIEYPPEARAELVATGLPVAFCNTAIPGDYRSAAQIAAKRPPWPT